MYVCICNAIRDRDFHEAAKDAETVSQVFKKCGARPKCGKCVSDVADIVEDTRIDHGQVRLAAE
ncbi:MAG: (2Fe-2S)-binding protein [Pseudomonadota bacterium]